MRAKILTSTELVYRLIEIRQGIDIPMGADRIYTCETVAKEYSRNHRDISMQASDFILNNASMIIKDTGISPKGLGCIYVDLVKIPGQAYTTENKFPYDELCKEFGYRN